MSTNRIHRIAVIPGDGIGQEVMPEGVRVLEAAAKKFGFKLQFDDFDFASCDYYDKHGRMMPEDWKEKIGKHDAIYFGAVGMPDRVPDHISLWGSLILFRREFDQYVNLRPVRLMPGVPCPLVGRKPGDIDFWVVRENTEGEYSAIGGKMFALVIPDDFPPSVNLKCDPDRALELRDRYEDIQPGYHMNKRHWNTLILEGRLPARLVRELIDHSYQLVTAGLSRKVRAGLGLT